MTTLDSAFSALSDPTRRAILSRLALGEATVMVTGSPVRTKTAAISRALRVLEEAGLITRRIEGATRPCLPDAKTCETMLATGMEHGTEASYVRLETIV